MQIEQNELINLRTQKELEEKELMEIKSHYEKLRLLLEKKGYARKRRENTATNFELITDGSSSTRYRRQKETKNILEFIHG